MQEWNLTQCFTWLGDKLTSPNKESALYGTKINVRGEIRKMIIEVEKPFEKWYRKTVGIYGGDTLVNIRNYHDELIYHGRLKNLELDKFYDCKIISSEYRAGYHMLAVDTKEI